MRQETFKLWDLVPLTSEIWRYLLYLFQTILCTCDINVWKWWQWGCLSSLWPFCYTVSWLSASRLWLWTETTAISIMFPKTAMHPSQLYLWSTMTLLSYIMAAYCVIAIWKNFLWVSTLWKKSNLVHLMVTQNLRCSSATVVNCTAFPRTLALHLTPWKPFSFIGGSEISQHSIKCDKIGLLAWVVLPYEACVVLISIR